MGCKTGEIGKTIQVHQSASVRISGCQGEKRKQCTDSGSQSSKVGSCVGVYQEQIHK